MVAMGDFNAMHRESFPARVLRSRVSRAMIEYWPHARTKDILARLSQMAIGDTMQRFLDSTSLVDIDTSYRPTTTPKMRGQEWMPSIRMAQIDHLLISPGVYGGAFSIGGDGGSDHRAISARLEFGREI